MLPYNDNGKQEHMTISHVKVVNAEVTDSDI